MPCSCGKADAAAKTPQFGTDTKPPHSILPEQSCIFCCEKHFAIAEALRSRFGCRMGFRLAILGELDCARRHARLEYRAIADAIAAIEQELVVSSTPPGALFEQAAVLIAAEIARHPGGVDDTGTHDAAKRTDSMATHNPLAGVVLFACAWRLATEAGYEGINRTHVIGDLAEAQIHLLAADSKLAENMRTFRHDIQSGNTVTKDAWFAAALALDHAMRLDWRETVAETGTDLAWLLNG